MDADGVDKTSDKYKEVEASLASRQELLKNIIINFWSRYCTRWLS